MPQATGVAVGALLPALVWPGHLAGLALGTGVSWSVELWAGIVGVTAMAGAVLGRLVPASTANRDLVRLTPAIRG